MSGQGKSGISKHLPSAWRNEAYRSFQLPNYCAANPGPKGAFGFGKPCGFPVCGHRCLRGLNLPKVV